MRLAECDHSAALNVSLDHSLSCFIKKLVPNVQTKTANGRDEVFSVLEFFARFAGEIVAEGTLSPFDDVCDICDTSVKIS